MCAPGGFFILGSARSVNIVQGVSAPVPEHLVRLDAFAIDLDEVTVGAVRTLVSSQGLPPPTVGDPQGFVPQECTYLGANASMNDHYPVNCVPWTTANRACQLLGKRLPTEAEWEYAAGNLGLRTSFPWGDNPDICSYAAVALGRPSVAAENTECLVPPRVLGPEPYGGAAFLDSTTLGLLNMGGNLREWVADVYDDYSGPCWQTGMSMLTKPVCNSTRANAPHTERGGSWADNVVSAHGYFRQGPSDDSASTYVGFRCAKTM
jgi:sulfatase modifying factor 1